MIVMILYSWYNKEKMGRKCKSWVTWHEKTVTYNWHDLSLKISIKSREKKYEWKNIKTYFWGKLVQELCDVSHNWLFIGIWHIHIFRIKEWVNAKFLFRNKKRNFESRLIGFALKCVKCQKPFKIFEFDKQIWKKTEKRTNKIFLSFHESCLLSLIFGMVQCLLWPKFKSRG